MAVFTNNLIIYTGTDYDQIFVLANEDSESALNLTTYTGYAKMKRHGSASTSTSFSVSNTDATNGKLKIALTASQTESLTPGRYYYDIVLKNSSGENIRVIEGEVFVKKSITRF